MTYDFPKTDGAYVDGTRYIALFDEDADILISFGVVSLTNAGVSQPGPGGSVIPSGQASYGPATGTPEFDGDHKRRLHIHRLV